MTEDKACSPPPLSLPGLFIRFLRFGCLAFGGPVAQIAMIRQALVEEEHWLSSQRFNRLLAVMQILPGPEAHELCVHMGMMARGRLGGFLAGLGFMLPGFVLMLLCAFAYVRFVAGVGAFDGALLGVQLAVLGVIARAVQRIAVHILVDRMLILLAAISATATLAGLPFWGPLLATGLVYACVRSLPLAGVLVIGLCVGGWLILPHGGMPLPAQAERVTAAGAVALFLTGLKGGLLTFGGAYTAIPYVRHDTVGRGWISDGAFLDGVALAGTLPALLVIFGTFVGYVAGGWVGAIAVTAGIFLPAFAFSMIFFERLEAVVGNALLHRFLDGVGAAVVGTIVATLLQLGASTFARTEDWAFAILLVGASLFAAWRLKGKWVTPAIVASGAAIGWAVWR